jgi:hypothetical protein
MQVSFNRLLAIVLLAFAALLPGTAARAQSWQLLTTAYSLKSGETVELGDLYWVIDCRSQLQAPPEVTVMEGPPGVTATVVEAMVTPRFQQCSQPVKGGKLKLTAGKIEDPSRSTMTLRVKYKTKDGERDISKVLNLSLFP